MTAAKKTPKKPRAVGCNRKGPGGRPTLINAWRLKRICKLIEEGLAPHKAAEIEEIPDSTHRRYMELGRVTDDNPGTPPYKEYHRQIRKAEHKYELWHIKNLNAKSERSGALSLQILERRCSEDWAPKQETKLVLPPIQVYPLAQNAPRALEAEAYLLRGENAEEE